MTLKEKAKERADEIYSKCYTICQEYTEEIQCSIQAKQCALIAVETVQNLCWGNNQVGIEHWKQVKQEIQKL
jgi:hypothetical protein